MADNLGYTPGTGATVASKDRGGVHEQRILAYGDLSVLTNDLTRPADTITYSINDAVADSTAAATLREFTGAARYTGGSGYITGATILTNSSSGWTSVGMRLWLYNTNAGIDVIEDNAPFSGPAFADRAAYVGYIDFPGFLAEGTGLTAVHTSAFDIRVPYTVAGTSLFAQYSVKSAPTANASGQVFHCKLFVEHN